MTLHNASTLLSVSTYPTRKLSMTYWPDMTFVPVSVHGVYV